MDGQSTQFVNAARFVAQKDIARFTRFLDPAQAHEALSAARDHGVSFTAWGGYEQAERVIGCFHPRNDEADRQAFPLVCLSARISGKFCHVTHRDLLGAFMALGLTRDCIGDIIISTERVYLFVTEQTAPFIAQSMNGAGKTSLSFEALDTVPDIPEPSGTAFTAVVSSLRLDAVLACAYHLSRSEAASLIRSGLVKVNHLPQERVDTLLKEGALLSLKGKGRVRFTGIDGTTRKQRIGISLFRYE